MPHRPDCGAVGPWGPCDDESGHWPETPHRIMRILSWSETEQRPSWDRYFLNIAHDVSTRATCTRRKVGAVLVRENRILTTGYNGSPPGQPHCTDTILPLGHEWSKRCTKGAGEEPGWLCSFSREEHHQTVGCKMVDGHCVRTIHAESNVISIAARHGVSTVGATLYVTCNPCVRCANALLSAGIVRVVLAANDYEDSKGWTGRQVLAEAGVSVEVEVIAG